MGRERFLFLPFPLPCGSALWVRPLGPPFGILTYPVGRVGVIHRSAWKWNSANFALTEFSEVRLAPFTKRGAKWPEVCIAPGVSREMIGVRHRTPFLRGTRSVGRRPGADFRRGSAGLLYPSFLPAPPSRTQPALA